MIPTTRDIEPLSIARFAPRELGPLHSSRSAVRYSWYVVWLRHIPDAYCPGRVYDRSPALARGRSIGHPGGLRFTERPQLSSV